MTDRAIAKEIGERLKNLRLRKNWSQKEIAEFTGLSRRAIQNAENGTSTLLTYIKILRPLKTLDTLDNFIPKETISPIQIMKMKGQKRQRATGNRKK